MAEGWEEVNKTLSPKNWDGLSDMTCIKREERLKENVMELMTAYYEMNKKRGKAHRLKVLRDMMNLLWKVNNIARSSIILDCHFLFMTSMVTKLRSHSAMMAESNSTDIEKFMEGFEWKKFLEKELKSIQR